MVDHLTPFGGSFADGGPTIKAQYLRSYHLEPELAPRTYRHPRDSELGLNALHCDGHVEWVSEGETRQPDPWYPSGTRISFSAFNIPTLRAVIYDLDPDNSYTVR